MDGLTLVLFVVGLVLLIGGAELLVRGASSLAMAVGISPLVVGLTVVAFGTSSPELAVTVQAGFDGRADIAVGNVVGSNIFNILFILGLSALIAPLVVSQQLIRLDVPLMIGVSALLLALAWDGAISRRDGLLLVAGIVLYTGFAVRKSRREARAIREEYEEAFGAKSAAPAPPPSLPVQLAMIGGGLALLVLGARWLVNGAVEIAGAVGVSDVVIGLTIVAAGTSLPEVATSVLAAVRGERDIAVGNVVGSNLYNMLAILGLSALVAPDRLGVPDGMIAFDLPVMIAVAFACLPIFFTGRLIARWEGGLFLAYYVAYTLYLVLDATGHDALDAYSGVMLAFVLPLTALTIGGLAVRALRHELITKDHDTPVTRRREGGAAE